MQPVSPKPPLPQAPAGTSIYEVVRWAGDLTKQLAGYLADFARLINSAVQTDGSTPMTGDLDLGGNEIIGAINVVSATKVTVFTANGTFTPDPNMIECEIWGWGGGGAGGGAAATAGATYAIGGGGHAGAKAYLRAIAATIGASQTVTIGAGGTGVSGGNGNVGGNTTLGALLSAIGGRGGSTGGPSSPGFHAGTSAAVQSATGTVRGWTTPGSTAFVGSVTAHAGDGGSNEWGGGAIGVTTLIGTNGAAAAGLGYGAGGGGVFRTVSQAAAAGGAGAAGIMIIKEYLHA